jgi:hypothetical protein
MMTAMRESFVGHPNKPGGPGRMNNIVSSHYESVRGANSTAL